MKLVLSKRLVSTIHKNILPLNSNHVHFRRLIYEEYGQNATKLL